MKTVCSAKKEKRRIRFVSKVLSFVTALCLLLSMTSYASVVCFNDDDFGILLNKVSEATTTSNGFVQFSIAGNNGNINMYNSQGMTEIIKKSMLYISFDYSITESGKSGLRVELRGYGNDKVKEGINPYWSGWQYDASAPVTANEIHHFEAVLDAKQLMIDANASNIANSYLFVGNVGSTLTLSNIRIREWTYSGRTLAVRTNDLEAFDSDKPEGYTGNVWHLNNSGAAKKTSRIIQDFICTFNAGEEYAIEFWYKNVDASASYFALVNNNNVEYAKVEDLVTTGEWTKAQFNFIPDSDMSGTFANITKKDVNGDVCFTDFVVLPKIPVSDTIAVTENEIMVVNGAEINIEGYFDAPEKLELKKDDKVIEAAKSNASSDFSGYTKATYQIIYNESFSDEGIYNIFLNDLWNTQRNVAVKLIKYSDELKQLSLQKADWTEIYSQENLSVNHSAFAKTDDGKFDLKGYLASDCAVFKVEFDIKIDAPVSDDSVTEITLRTGSDPGHTVYKINNSELTAANRHYSYIDNQSLSDRYNLSNGKINDRYKNSQWWFFVRNRCASQNVTLSNIRIYALTKNAAGSILLGTARLENKNASQSKSLNGALAVAKYDSNKNLTEFKAESFELADKTVLSGETQVVLKNGVQSGETGYANIIIDMESNADASSYKCFWFDSPTNIRPLAAACTYGG